VTGPSRPSFVKIWLAAARPRTLPAAIAPVLVGSGLALHDARFQAGPALLCLVFALLVQIGTNFANDYFDFIHGADTASRLGPPRAVASGWVTPAAMRLAMLGAFAAALIAGSGLIFRGGPWMAAVGGASIACGIAYTGGPFPLGYHGWGDVLVFFGPVAVSMTYFVQAGRISAVAVMAAVPIGLLTANILVVNNYRDAETDAAAGKRTLVVQFGRGFARIQYCLCLAIALLAPFLFWREGFRPGCLLPLALAPLGWRQLRRLRVNQTPAGLIGLLGDTAKFLAAYATLFAVGINL
jgi:1,4-dihydroxy-2-naphthoate octaprenyltransferase